MYTTPSDTTGAAVSEPEYDTPAAALPVSSNDQASLSCDTLADEITEPGATLVLARSPFGYGHCPEGAVAPGKVVVNGVGLLPLRPLRPAWSPRRAEPPEGPSALQAARPMPGWDVTDGDRTC